ncbi:protein ENHANCED DISEASE RESISTANCE 4 [Raphanus sativus]|uniref:Protein ENHANCED DISEASE RESISTANCE 4 n=1 Tax=Raphanus sativus TaxID=3726 RepID=A0A6J0MUD4_RAPSA|nr:protein ENHANCED DISEASE RESISTANCE 4 [Raphanus sativus]
MASKSGQRVRLVKCPKCLKILQEDEDVPVYQCGGCSAILQAKRRSTAPKTAPSAGETEGPQASEHPNTAPSAGETEGPQASEPPNTATSAGDTEGAQASEPPNTVPTAGETERDDLSDPPNTAPSAGETEEAQASEPPSEPETNNVSSSRSGQDTVLPSPTGSSSVQEDDKAPDGSMESSEKQLGGLELSKGEESNQVQMHEHSLGDSDKNEGEDNSSRLMSDMKSVEEATRSRTSSGMSLNADHVVDARASISSSEAYNKLEAEISPDSPFEEEQDQGDHVFHPHRDSTDDLPKTSSAYDGSKSSSDDEREDQDENQQWNALQNLRSDKFEMQRYPQNFKEQGGSSSSTFSHKRPSGTTTYKSLQLEGPGGRLGRQGRRHVSEQLRPDVPLYPRESYTRLSPSYPSHDVFDRYSRAHSLQMPPPYEGVDHMYHNNARGRERGQGSRFSGEMTTNDTRNQHPGWYSGQMYNSSYSSYSASPQRLTEQQQQPEYYHPRWSHEIVSDAEDHHQRNRHADLQARRRQPVAKRHIRPTAGGAPLVSCYSCSANLQLPADFLIFKRKYHLLRCGTCNTVLRFSLQSRTHLVPAVVTHDISANRSSNSTSESPSKPEKQSSSAAQEEEEEDVPVGRGSPLHRLMGYSTVSQVFKASQRPPSV